MTHEEYLSRLEGFTDSSEDAREVVHHAGSCASCWKERRFVERRLWRLEPARRSIAEEVVRIGTTAAVVAILVLGVHRLSVKPEEMASAPRAARYRIVGNASGVVAYTPSGVIVGTSSAEKGVTQ